MKVRRQLRSLEKIRAEVLDKVKAGGEASEAVRQVGSWILSG